MTTGTYRITGRVLERQTRRGIGEVRVEAWDKDLLIDDLVGSAVTAADGSFVIEFDRSHFQELFLDRSPDLFFKVFWKGTLVRSTEKSVLWNVRAGDIPVVIELDLAGTGLPVPADPARPFLVRGRITIPGGAPAAGVTVLAVERGMREEAPLGQAETDAQGVYEIAYELGQVAGGGLQVRVFDRQDREVGASPVIFDPPAVQVIDVEVDRRAAPSDYEREVAAVLAHAGQTPLAELTDDDLDFLESRTGISGDHLRYIRLSAQWSGPQGADAAVFYGLLRQGLPTDYRSLLARKPSRWKAALEAALDKCIVPAALADDLDGALARLEERAVSVAFEPETGEAAPPVGVLLRTSGLSEEQQSRIVRFSLHHDRDDEFWEKLRSEPGMDDDAVAAARFTFEAGALLHGHLPTLEAVQQRRQKEGWRTVRDLPVDRAGWAALAKEAGSVPPAYENADQFAAAMAHAMELSFPTTVVARRVAGDQELGGADVAQFLAANPDFDLLATPIDAFFENGAQTGQIGDVQALKVRLGQMQRTLRIVPAQDRYDGMRALLTHGFDSAHAITLKGKRAFEETMTPVMGQQWVDATFANAQMRAEYAEALRVIAWDYLGDVKVNPQVERLPAELPTWARMFGTVGGCECRHCRSVLGPAAYLADLLKFLDDAPVPAGAAGARPPFEVFRERRPDIEHILLDCDNANVMLPHIDLVNEILEQAVLGRAPAAYQTEGTAEALRAEPAHEDAAAYAVLEGAVFPWALPFDLAHERVRLFAEHLGLELDRLWRLFGRDPADVTRAALGLNPAEWELLTAPAASGAALAALWGVGTLAELGAVPVFLDRSGLSIGELDALTRTWFLSADGIGPVRLNRGDLPCDIADDRLEGLSPAVLDQVHRFIRLSRKLGWALGDGAPAVLDRVLQALGRRTIDGETLGEIARVKELSAAFGIPADELVSLDRAALAAALRVSDHELDLFTTLIGRAPAGAAADVLATLEQWRDFRESGMDVRELAYILLGKDQTPAAFTPSDDEIRTLLRSLHAFIAGTDAAADAEATLVENLATHLALDVEVVDRLLRPAPRESGTPAPALLHAEDDPSAPAIADLVAFIAIPATDGRPDEASPETFARARRLLLRLDRVARLVRGLGLTRRELDALAETAVDNGFLDLAVLPVLGEGEAVPAGVAASLFAGWLALLRARRVQRQLPRADKGLFDFLHEAAAGRYTGLDLSSPATFADLSAHTGWAAADIAVLAAALGLDAPSFRQVATYDRLAQAFDWLRRFRIDAAELRRWAAAATPTTELAEALRSAARARHGDEASWRRVLTPISDRLREAKRDALLAYLVHHARNSAGERRFDGPAAVYAEYLIDPEMSSCALTSRIVQAAAAVQLFLQRCRIGLEPDVVVSDEDGYWSRVEWMKSYRVWEAGRKVFLYPENWVAPELRDDKSPPYREFETEMLQDDVRAETVERAVRTYLEKLSDVAHLDVRGLYHEEDSDTLHVFARTRATPHVYYYRRRLRARGWTAWERVDLDIQGNHLMPVVHAGRLLLFWPIIEEHTDIGRSRESDADDERYLKVKLAWSEFQNGKWQARRVGTDIEFATPLTSPDDLGFRTSIEDGDLYIRVLVRSVIAPRMENGAMIASITRLRFDPCTRNLVYAPAPERQFYLPPERTTFAGMQFVEDEDRPGDQLYVLTDVGSDVLAVPEVFDQLLREGGLAGILFFIFLAPAGVLALWQRFAGTGLNLWILERTPGRFEILPAHQSRQFTGPHPFFFKADGRTYAVTPYVPGGAVVPYYKYRFEVFYHPYVCPIIRAVEREGLEALAAGSAERPAEWPARQRASEAAVDFRRRFQPRTTFTSFEVESVDFSRDGAYSIYNWELFFHIPLHAAQSLSRAGRFDEAERWFRFIFDPTDTSMESRPANVWRVKRFFEEALNPPETVDALLRRLAAGHGDVVQQVEAWRDDPFNPHAIARLRVRAYMRSVVMAYLDHIIARADALFREDRRESINEAAQLYLLAAEILGERPVTVPREDGPALDYHGLRERLDEFANALVDFETMLPADLDARPVLTRTGPLPPNLLLYFCVPPNDRLLSYWDTIADRLFKIRNCMDIEGRVRDLALFDPPIDPALLVRARAAGLDPQQALRVLSDTPLPHYRYAALYPKAVEACNEVRSLGAALLAALEKKDAEELSLLRSRHEIALASLVRTVRAQQVDEAAEALSALRLSLASAEQRRAFYESREFMNEAEITAAALQSAAHIAESIGQGYSLAAAVAHVFPQVHTQGVASGVSTGGQQAGDSLRAWADVSKFVAAQLSFAASMTSTMAGYQRRKEDWDLQAALARTEVEQIQRQIAAAEIRLAIAERELENHEKQIEQARETEDFLRGKFTNRELYAWMASQLSALHRQAYQAAYELAKKAERAAQHELGLEPAEFHFIQFDHWDSPKRGLLAGERLHQELRRMDSAYMERNRREYEITKHVSLAMLNPEELVRLRETGRCTVHVPEILFDLDFPGQLRRRIRSVSLTIPAVTGPYTNVSAKLTLDASYVRWVEWERPEDRPTPVSVPRGAIATSSAQKDSGLFEFSFRDERYLPFEGAGAISTWTLELPGAFRPDAAGSTPAEVLARPFDYDTISDVVLHIQYTARDGSPEFRSRVAAELSRRINDWIDGLAGTRTPLVRLFSLRQEFSSQLHRFLHPAADESVHEAHLVIEDKHFPHFLRDYFRRGLVDVQDVMVIVKPAAREDAVHFRGQEVALEGAAPYAPQAFTVDESGAAPNWGGLPVATFSRAGAAGAPTGQWVLRVDAGGYPAGVTIEPDGRRRLDPAAIEDIFLAMRYSIRTAP